MTGTNLREFEKLVVLTVAWLVEEVYSLAICEELATHSGRSVKLNVVHSVLIRLEEKGHVKSKMGEATNARGGKRKRFYQLTIAGKAALVHAKSTPDQRWNKIPSFVWEKA